MKKKYTIAALLISLIIRSQTPEVIASFSEVMEVTKVNNDLYFGGYTADSGADLYKSDGTSAGTQFVKNGLYPSSYLSATAAIEFNGEFFLIKSSMPNIHSLWKSDGTEAGTLMIKDIAVAGTSPNSFVKMGNMLYFVASDGIHGNELWKSDGTETGTVMVKDICTGENNTNLGASRLIEFNGSLYFCGFDNTNGTELYKSDGTEAGTVMLKNIKPGTGSANPRYFAIRNNELYFTANDTESVDLWKTNGTTAGTIKITNTFISPENITNINGTLYFSASDDANATELWKSDGTNAGTVLVKNIASGNNSSFPSIFKNINGKVLFVANGRELWKSDGTEVGTTLVKDGFIGNYGESLKHLTMVNGVLYFSANDGANGIELWKSDGTTAGTTIAADVNVGAGSSNPSNFVQMNDDLYFKTFTNTSGNLYKLAVAPLGINQNQIATVTLYPNPTSNILTIKSEDTIDSVLVIDVFGRTNRDIDFSNGFIDVSHFSNGIYFIEIEIHEKLVRQKFIKN